MPVVIQVEPETGMAIATCSGTLGATIAKESAVALWKAPGWRGESVVWDFRAATFEITSQEIRELAQFILKSQPPTPPSRVAFVTGSAVDFGLSRMFEVFREDPATELRVFSDYEKALAWARPRGG